MIDLHSNLILKQTVLTKQVKDFMDRIEYKLNTKTKQKIFRAYNDEIKNITQLIDVITNSYKKDESN